MDESARPILLHYAGRDADGNEIEIGALADSLHGLSRVLGVSANFSATHKYLQHKDALAVRILVKTPEAGSFDLMAWVKWAEQDPLFVSFSSGLCVILVAYIFKKAAGDREEMRQLRGALDEAIRQLGTRDTSVVERLLATIDKMAENLRPAVRQAVSPVGKTVNSLSIGEQGKPAALHIDQMTKDAILAGPTAEVSNSEQHIINITELDVKSGSCKFSFEGDDENRVQGIVTDPAVFSPNNEYALSMTERRAILVQAKTVTKDGVIEKLYISDTMQP